MAIVDSVRPDSDDCARQTSTTDLNKMTMCPEPLAGCVIPQSDGTMRNDQIVAPE